MSEELAFGAHIPSGELQNEYLSFWADRQRFAVPIREVRQIIRMQQIVEVPDYPAYARGIINLRGDIIPIIDVRMRLGKPEVPYNDRTCIIIIDVEGHQYGIVVDQVSEVMEIAKNQFSQPPRMGGVSVNEYLNGIAKIEDKVVMALDCSKLLKETEYQALVSAAEA